MPRQAEGHADVSFWVWNPTTEQYEQFNIRTPYFSQDTIVEDAVERVNSFLDWYSTVYQWDYVPILGGGDLFFQAIY